MKLEELERIGEELGVEGAEAELRSLMADRRMAAVVRLLRQQQRLSSEGSCQLAMADRPGLLAHAAGVYYAIEEVLGRLREAGVKAPRAKGQQKPEEE